MVKVGDRLQLWPKDKYPKYGIVRETSSRGVVVEITEVDPRDYTRYKPGHVITFPWSHFRVVFNVDKL
ncbi:hypothetical protein JOC37_002624 [Desulfohalotomaculum tongense]|uniref:hypothetical protein n=1 Tax=Desulforadius tongensis TaxID=1216062 RepID=UPI00195D20A5|nr:hypothetical protein [Desulforadius tongensis]MBM7856191.1 hypothetical protein [Desulforadius tongensis]